MKILAVDTSTLVASVSITENDKVLAEYTINLKKTHSQRLMPMINDILRIIELTPEDIDVFSSAIGPGSFTGLRIGVTTVKALAYTLKKKVIGVPTLEALAHNISDIKSLVCPIIDARNDQVYTAIYDFKSPYKKKCLDDSGIDINELIYILKLKNENVMFVGEGVEVHKKYLIEQLGDLCSFANENLNIQRASSVAKLAYIKAIEGKFDNCMEYKPFYLKKTSAEREYEKLHGKE